MQIAVISDIHGNLEAFQAVIASLEERKPDRVVCLGDLVGYGPDPEAVVQLAIRLGYDCVLGNHEVALLSPEGRERMNSQARENNISTEKLLSGSSMDHFRQLSRTITTDRALFLHGFPPDSVFKYLYSQSHSTIRSLFDVSPITHFFVGHTHALLLIHREEERIVKASLERGKTFLEDREKYLINVGSVGQPRDGDNRAKYVIWDTRENTLDVLFIQYDFESTVKKIKERGFPEAYGLRLS